MRKPVIFRGEDGYWVAECPSLPGCISQGETKEKTLENIKDDKQIYFLQSKYLEKNICIHYITSYISKKAEIYDHFSEKQKDFIDMLEQMNIECRYPVHKDELMKSLTEERCKEILDNTKGLQIWIKQRL